MLPSLELGMDRQRFGPKDRPPAGPRAVVLLERVRRFVELHNRRTKGAEFLASSSEDGSYSRSEISVLEPRYADSDPTKRSFPGSRRDSERRAGGLRKGVSIERVR